ncbi:MAG: OmpA family protein, partial [Myxococcales bacterium]|nr:OmpA family protein [Myxococcales bacterium]
HDGIPDHLDKCPNEPETINGFQDDDGCPDVGPGPRVVISGNQIVIKDKVYFDTGSDALKPTSHSILDQVAQILRANPQMLSVLVEGHTDNQGDLEMNVDLSQRRAQRVMAYLIDKGVERKRLKAKGFGPKIPVADNKDREGRAQNRRVAFKILVLYKAPPKLKAPPKPKAPPKLKAPPKPKAPPNSSGRLGGAR